MSGYVVLCLQGRAGQGSSVDARARSPLSASLIVVPNAHNNNTSTRKKVLTELAGDRALERFRLEYERLYRALKKSHGAVGWAPACGDAAAVLLRFVFVQQQHTPPQQ